MTRHLSALSVGGVAAAIAGLLAVPVFAQHDRGTPTGSAVPRSGPSSSPPPSSPPPSSGHPSGGSSGPASTGGTSTPRSGDSGGRDSSKPGSTNASGPRDDAPAVGRAVPRKGPPPHHGGGGGIDHDHGYGGYYPWGLGFAGYYAGYYGAYDPWYGWYPAYGPSGSSYGYEGSLRLKMKPVEALVRVDGYYAGSVDDFDGVFQSLHLDPGPHRIEISSPGYETLSFEVRIEPDHKTTYEGKLVTLP